MTRKNPHAIAQLEKLFLLLDTDPDLVASMPIEDVREDLREMGIDTRPLLAKVRQMISEAAKQRENEKVAAATDEGAREQAARVPSVRTAAAEWWSSLAAAIATAVHSLSEFPSDPSVPQAVLGNRSGEESPLKAISLRQVFDESVLQERFPWAGPLLHIARTVEAPDMSTASYAASIEVRAGEKRQHGSLRLVLTAASGQSSQVRLSADCSAAVFVGDALPSDWDMLKIALSLEPEAYDA